MSRFFVVKSPHARRRVAPSALACLLGVASASAQTIDPRVVAAFGPGCTPVRETAIAAGEHKVIALFMEGAPVVSRPVYYTIYDIQSGIWSEGIVPMGIFVDVADPSIVYDPQSCDFVLTAIGQNSLTAHVVVARYDARDAKFSSWVSVHQGAGLSLDKTWIVAGEPGEFYIVYWRTPGYAYRRWTAGGDTWEGGDITVDSRRVLGGWCAQPTVAGDGPLYVAYMHADNRIRFLSGQDLPGNLVDFAYLTDDQTRPPPPIEVRLNRADVTGYLPGTFSAFRTPQLVADPTNANRLYLVYHDTGTADPSDRDVNIYLHKLTPTLFGGWQVGRRRARSPASA